MPNKILIITPFSLEPAFEGNRRRIRLLAEELVDLGAEVHVALLPLKPAPQEEIELMKRKWGKRFHLLPPKYSPTHFGRLVNKVQRLCYPSFARLLTGHKVDGTESAVDAHYFAWWTVTLRSMGKRMGFDVVIAEYIFMSQAFSAFDKAVLKIIDTHDVFANRNSRISKSGLNYNWWSVTESEEAEAIRRADVILAIEAGEAEQFRSYTQHPVHCLPYVPACEDQIRSDVNTYTILIVGSANPINIQGALWFITEVLPKVCSTLPQANLSVVGDVCNGIEASAALLPNIKLLGRVDTLNGCYAAAGVVVNPVQVGTGLCIKSMEALAHARPLVSTPSGARGIGAESGVFVVQSAEEMAAQIVHLLKSPLDRKSSAIRGQQYLKKLKSENRKLLVSLLAGERRVHS